MNIIKHLLLLITVFSHFSFLQAGIVVLNGLSHTHKVENGKVYRGSIALENNGNKLQNVKLFLQDFTYHSDGTIHYSAPDSHTRTNSGWIRMNTNLVILKAKEKTEIVYEITVPDQVSGPGSYWSVIMVEPVEEIKPDENRHGVSITSVIRYAVQVITDINTERAKPDLQFEGIKLGKENGKRFLNVAIANKGNLYCKPTVTVEIYNKTTGQKTGTFSSLAMGLLPQTSKSFPIDLEKTPAAKYNAVLIATDEDENAFALNVELEVKDG
ncbi:WxL protein host-binding domain-containing protein [Chryseobacterium hagamense]|uniref:WxL Interacting Protein host binding domain-containing protein n=1 Tax=Chryseobacterium hagamense TaxID=395935 RepID=A0A511YQJ7_9FLAO|nr:DUF3324 domain-containing protein [Chryseobacterium hagamense]GEN77461.1 hypothetical protein CHA01nite_32010 [Chryseobacterium hagamense]